MRSHFLLLLIPLLAESRVEGQTNVSALREECASGRGMACLELGRSYLSARVVPGDPIRAVRLFELACRAGELTGCHELAVRHALGFGTDENYQEAARIFDDACGKGHAVSCRHSALMYSSGVGVIRDEARAATLYQTACDASDAHSCEDLAVAYLEGQGVPVDRESAAAFLTRACDAGAHAACVRRWLLDHPPSRPEKLLKYGNTIDSAVIRLRDDRWRTRARMAEELGELGPDAKRALPDLLPLLEDSQGAVRNAALYAITHIGPPPDDIQSASAVFRALSEMDDDPDLRWTVAEALGAYGEEAVPRLLTLLSDESPEVRASAVRSLGRIGASSAAPGLLSALEDEVRIVRWEAAIALASTESDRDPVISELLRDASRANDAAADVRVRAAGALAFRGQATFATASLIDVWNDADDGRFGREQRLMVIEALEDLGPLAGSAKSLLRKTLSDRDPVMRDRGLSALKKVAPSEADAWLGSVREKERSYHRKGLERRNGLKASSAGARVAAIRALDGDGDPGKTVPFLVAFLDDTRDFEVPTEDYPEHVSPSQAASEELIQVGAPAVEAMIGSLGSSSEWERHHAVRVLGRVGGSRAVEALLPFLDDSALGFSSAAALVGLKDPRGVPVLVSELDGPETFLQWQAARSLADLPDPRATDALIRVVRTSASYDARRSAAEVLGAIGDPRAIDALLEMVENDHELLRWDAAHAVSLMGNEAFRAAQEALGAESTGRRLAAMQVFEQLGRRNDPRVVELLAEHLGRETSKEVKEAAVGAIRGGGSLEALDALLIALRDPDTRLAAARELYDVEDRKAIGPLMKSLDGAGEDESAMILNALRRVTGRTETAREQWLSWWEGAENEWSRKQAFLSRRVRVQGRVEDETGQPLGDVQILAARAGNDPTRGFADASSASSCLQDEFGALFFVNDGDDLLNPYAATDTAGDFEMGDWKGFFLPDERYVVFASSRSGCRRLFKGDDPASFTVGIEDERIDLEALTLRR